MPPPYVVDASAWIDIGRFHPRDIFVTLWHRLDSLIAAGDLISPEDVLRELERGADDLAEYLETKAGLFLPLDEAQQTAVAEVLAACPTLANAEGERNRADPFVVALARIRGGSVVSQERTRGGASGRYSIPDACAHFTIPCLRWLDFLREVGWQL